MSDSASRWMWRGRPCRPDASVKQVVCRCWGRERTRAGERDSMAWCGGRRDGWLKPGPIQLDCVAFGHLCDCAFFSSSLVFFFNVF